METRELGRSGVQAPLLGVGAMTWGDPAAIPRFNPARVSYGLTGTRDDQREALEAAIAAGAGLVDTAAIYGKGESERRVGDLAAGKNVLIATKFPSRFIAGADTLPADLEASLKRLQRTVVDLYQVHFPARRSIPRTMDLMADAVRAGKVRAVGVSNFSAKQLREAHAALARHSIALASNQVQYSLLHRTPESDGVLDTCRELGVTLIAYMPLASGALTGKYSAENAPKGVRRFQSWFRPGGMRASAPVHEVLAETGKRHGRSPAQVALRWLIERGALPIPGARNREQAVHNAGALTFSLSKDEVEALDAVTAAWKK